MELIEGIASVGDVDDFVATLGEIGDDHGTTVQAFDARYVAGRRHLECAVELADRARERDDAIARDRGVEILLYAAGRRQISRALAMGVDEGETPVVVLVEGGDEDGAASDVRDLLAPQPTLGPDAAGDEERIRGFFEITEAEREATDATLVDLVCERVALLSINK